MQDLYPSRKLHNFHYTDSLSGTKFHIKIDSGKEIHKKGLSDLDLSERRLTFDLIMFIDINACLPKDEGHNSQNAMSKQLLTFLPVDIESQVSVDVRLWRITWLLS